MTAAISGQGVGGDGEEREGARGRGQSLYGIGGFHYVGLYCGFLVDIVKTVDYNSNSM